MKKSILGILSLLAGLILVMVFQNCNSLRSETKSDFSEQMRPSGIGINYERQLVADGGGNGDPYGGKLFYFISPNYNCNNGGQSQTVDYKEKIELMDGYYVRTINNCGALTTEKIADAQVATSSRALQFEDRLYYNLGQFKIDDLNRLLDPQIFWNERICHSDLTEGYTPENGHYYEFEVYTNLNGQRKVLTRNFATYRGELLSSVEQPAQLNDYGSQKQWVFNEQTLSFSERANFGEAILIENGIVQSMRVNCVLNSQE